MNGVLFEDIIQSINFDQHEILCNIQRLYCPDGFDLDPTYRTGAFYKGGVKHPFYFSDIDPRDDRVARADCRNLAYPNDSFESIIFDPPFLAGGGKWGKMNLEYSAFKTMGEMADMIIDSMREFQRILRPQGILVFKCQDSMYGRQQYFTHANVYEWAGLAGFEPIDLFIKLNKTAMIPSNYTNQNCARKMHSYFWVFRLRGRRRKQYANIGEATL